ncbi:uncharacterized protein LOC110346052, partial [Heterocephalus glaber]|uniref:Uncharacterized protein LOC110346052 n=1 Tax=Heterocephalus glaber TaxID=10181 RepID=A0AAX6RZW9_HETGA
LPPASPPRPLWSSVRPPAASPGVSGSSASPPVSFLLPLPEAHCPPPPPSLHPGHLLLLSVVFLLLSPHLPLSSPRCLLLPVCISPLPLSLPLGFSFSLSLFRDPLSPVPPCPCLLLCPHCPHPGYPSDYQVWLGRHSLFDDEDTAQHVTVSQSFPHPLFNMSLLEPHPSNPEDDYSHDLMLLRLKEPARITESVQVLALPSEQPETGSTCGLKWGSTVPGPKKGVSGTDPAAREDTQVCGRRSRGPAWCGHSPVLPGLLLSFQTVSCGDFKLLPKGELDKAFIKKVTEGWGFSSVISPPAAQAEGPEFDPRYQKKKKKKKR